MAGSGIFTKALRAIAIVVVLAALALVIAYSFSTKLQATLAALSPPQLPELVPVAKREWLAQGWSRELADKYHYMDQGSSAFLVPASWMFALEQPAPGIFSMPFGKRGRYLDDDYFLRFGFIKGEVSENNPHGLPIGLTEVGFQVLPGVSQRATGLGLTCAACHTARLRYGDTEYLVDGGPASTDLALVSQSLGAALGQTLVSAKLSPLLGGRFDRFARGVLGPDGYNKTNIARLEDDLTAVVSWLQQMPNNVDVVEGFTRVDALNRIGNALFSIFPVRPHNYVPPNAPANYPPIWTASWFNWVQYDGSIMGPLIRNAGEALGLGGLVNLTAAPGQQRYSASIPMENLYWIESALDGDAPPYPDNRKFAGLQAPAWPAAMPPIDRARADRGAILYQQRCQGCHLAPLNSPAIWSDEYFAPVSYFVDGIEYQTKDALLRLNIIPLDEIGTDPSHSAVLATRTVDTSADATSSDPHLSDPMGIANEVCTWSAAAPPSANHHGTADAAGARRLENVAMKDGPMLNFGLALGSLVQDVTDQWFDASYIPKSSRKAWLEDRPNCLQVGQGYKARPLNGVWATAPYLHNGAIPTLMDLLSPPDERPDFVVLGDVEFDPVKVGIKQPAAARFRSDQKYNSDRFFVLDTSVKGNSNRGHEFSSAWDSTRPYNEQQKGVIGPELSREQRLDLVEYLKTL
ncbi:MAG: hypothetical protein H6985_12995 [Pseudomonadales bacterium]|nr:hypothetical protein [Pseudomonadales bacterium]